MHLPLLLEQDTLLKTTTPWPNLCWIGEDANQVYSLSQHIVREVDLSCGSGFKAAKLTHHIKTAAAISATHDGVYVYGILSSGELFFWHTLTNQLRQAKGISEMVTPTTHPPESNVMRGFLKHLLPQRFEANVTSDGGGKASCSVPTHLTPKVFASSNCSKVVVVVLGASQVNIWEKSVWCQMEDYSLSQHVPGNWSVAECPVDIPLPNKHSKETHISCCFMNVDGSEECHISFIFVECSSVVVNTLTLRWQESRCNSPTAHWNPMVVSFSALGVKENELLHMKETLNASYAHGQSFLAVAVNSQRQPSKLLYMHSSCSTAVITNIQNAVPHLKCSDKYSSRSHWVSDLTWSHDNLYLVGCLMSGALFVATRMGPLIKISCQGGGLQLPPANIIGIQPHSFPPSDEVCEEEGNTNPGKPPNISFRVSSHPRKYQVLLSSGFRASRLSFPFSGRKEGELVDCLLSSANHALHLLCNSAVTHDYAYIRDSTWRLAHSVLDLTQGISNASLPNSPKISLWDRKVAAAAGQAGDQERTPGDEGDLIQIDQVMKPLMAAWTLIGSRSGPHTMEWRRRAGEVVVVVVKLMATLLRVTTHDDHFEHQLQLLLVLHFYHQYVRVLCVWPNSFHMMKPALQLTHKLLHTVLTCERHSGERSMVSTLLVLTQTLSSVEHSLTQAFVLRPLHPKTTIKVEAVEGLAGKEDSNLGIPTSDDGNNRNETVNTIHLRMKKVWQCLHENAKKVYIQTTEKKIDLESYQKSILVLNIIQSNLQNIGCNLSERVMKLGKCHQLYLDGLYLKAIQAWKCEIITCLAKGHGKKVVTKNLHSILYASFVHEGVKGVASFINWVDSLLRSLFCPKKSPSLPHNVNKSDSKDKNDDNRQPYDYFRINQSPMKDIKHRTTTNESQEVKESVIRKTFPKVISSENGAHTFLPMKRKSSQEHSVEPSSVPWMVSAVRQVMGNLGRILALESVGCRSDVPSPHKPHNIPPLWTSTLQLQGKANQLSTIRKGEPFYGSWCVDDVAQALALAGYWGDLAVFTSWLDDAKMGLVAGVLASTTDDKVCVPETVLPLHQIKDLLCHPATSTAAGLHTHYELLQVAAMADLQVVPVILDECLANMKKLTPLFETFVPSHLHLPAPPVFCPLGPQYEEEWSCDITSDNSHSERRLRQEVAGWLRLAFQVTSAAGIAYPLLVSLQQEYTKVPLTSGDNLNRLVESLGCLQENWHPQGPEWEKITLLWHYVITEVWLLYSRDKLSFEIRSLVKNVSTMRQNQELLETCILEILSWVETLTTLCGHDSWKSDLVSCAITAASESPPVCSVAIALAKVVPHPTDIPSLLRDKAERLFDNWKNSSIPVSEVEPRLKEEKNGREDISSPEVYTSLYSFYEDRCGEIDMLISSEEERKESSCYMNTCATKSLYGTLAARTHEEFSKFLALFVELTFLRDVQKFPQQTSSVPLLVQFGDVLRRREFEGMRLRNKIHQDRSGRDANSLNQNSLNSVTTINTRQTITTSEKKGFFRSLDYSKMLPKGRGIIISSEKKHGTSTPRSTPSGNSALQHFEKEKLKSKKSVSSWRKLPPLCLHGRRSRSLSRHKKRSVCVHRPQSLPSRGENGTVYQRLLKQHSKPPNRKTSESSSDVTKDLPIQKLFYLPHCLGYTALQSEDEDTLKLLNWMLSQDRQLCLPVMETNSDMTRMLRKRINFTGNDVINSYCWNHLVKFWSHMKGKSVSEMENTELKKKKIIEKILQRKPESVEGTPQGELVSSIGRNVEVEVNQDTKISLIACPTKDLDMKSLKTSRKSKKNMLKDSIEDDENNEQLHMEKHGADRSNSRLRKKDKKCETENRDYVQVDSESASPIHLPCDSPDIEFEKNSGIENNSIDIPDLNSGSIISSSKSRTKQVMESGYKEFSTLTQTHNEDQDPHQQDVSPASQITESALGINRKILKSSLMSSQIAELEPKDTSNYMRTRENYSRSEDSSLMSPLNVNHKNPTKRHQRKVLVMKANQSAHSRLPILPGGQRVSNMTGIEAPEEPSDTGSLSHSLHLPSVTSSGSRMSRPPDVPDGRDTMPSESFEMAAAEDTLDNITLPESLHTSDLEEQNEKKHSIQNDIMERNKDGSAAKKSKDRGPGMSVPLCTKGRMPHHQWNFRNLNFKHVASQVKSDPITFPREEIDTSRSEKSITHTQGNGNTMKTLKLLTLPKLSSPKKCDVKKEKSLIFKQLPVCSKSWNTFKDNQDKSTDATVSPWLQCKEGRMEDMEPLIIPRCFDSHPMDNSKRKALNLLNPHQVFAFYKHKQSDLKNHAEKFRNLKVSKKYKETGVQQETPTQRVKEQIKSQNITKNLSRGFLDQVKDCASKYKKGNYGNILRIDEEIRVHYKPADRKTSVGEDVQKNRHSTGKSKPMEDNASYTDLKDNIGAQKGQLDISRVNVMRERKLETKYVNTEPYEMRKKVTKTIGIQASITEEGRIDDKVPPKVPIEIQTQTPSVQMVEASMLTDTVVSDMNIQVDSLLPQPSPASPPTSTQGQEAPQPSPPPPLPPSPVAPSDHSQTSSVIGLAQGFVRIFDTPTAVVEEELKDMEMNKTIHSLHVERGGLVIQNLFDSDENRITEECFDKVNKDLKKDARNDTRKCPSDGYDLQNRDIYRDLSVISPAPSPLSEININNDELTMDQLYEEFCNGRMSLEALYEMSTNIPECEVKEKTPGKRNKRENIEALEQQVSEAAQSISESQHLIERVECLIHEPEGDRHAASNWKSEERFFSNSSCRQKNSIGVADISEENVRWQEGLSVYEKENKTDARERFLDAAEFENITGDMIAEINQCEDTSQLNKALKKTELKRNNDSNLLIHKRLSNTTVLSNNYLPKMREVAHQEFLQREVDVDSTSSCLMTTEHRMKGISSWSESPNLHLNLASVRSVDNSHHSTVDSLLGESSSSFSNAQERKREIQAFIMKKRQNHREQVKTDLKLLLTKPRRTLNVSLTTSQGCSGMSNEVTNIAPENIGLTGKQLQKRNLDRIMKRAKENEHHQKKREADIAELLDDHKEDVGLYQSQAKLNFVSESLPTLRKSRKLQNSKNTLCSYSPVGTKTRESSHYTPHQGFVTMCKPRLSRYFKNSTEDWRTRKQHSPINSNLRENFSSEKKKYCVKDTSLERSTSRQMELFYWKRYLDDRKDKYKTGCGSIGKQQTSLEQSYHILPSEGSKNEENSPIQTKEKNFNYVARESSLGSFHPLNVTFTLPLDRISEVASNTTDTSLSEGHQGIPSVPAGEDTSTDSSWNVPEEVQKLLYSNQ